MDPAHVHGLPNDGGAILLEDGKRKPLDVLVCSEDGEGTSCRTGPTIGPLVRQAHGGPGSAAVPFGAHENRELLCTGAAGQYADRPGTAILTLGKPGERPIWALHAGRTEDCRGSWSTRRTGFAIPVPREQRTAGFAGWPRLTADQPENGEHPCHTSAQIAPHHR